MQKDYPDSKVHGAYMGPTWVLSAPAGPHVGPMNLAIRLVSINSDPTAPHPPTQLSLKDSSLVWEAIEMLLASQGAMTV